MVEAEEHIIESIKRGEVRSFDLLYTEYVAQIYRFVALKVGTKHEAEDLTHEVFLSALTNIRSYKRTGSPFSSWLYQIARNKVIDYYRTKKSHVALDAMDPDSFGEDSGLPETLDIAFQTEKVRTAIRKLPEEHQTILILRFVEDLSPREIAKIIKKSEGTIRVAQHRALEHLKQLLT